MKKFPALFLAAAILFSPALAALRNGAAAPPFIAIAPNGAKVSLKSYKGKKAVLLYFWDAGFGICKDELKELNGQYEDYRSKGVEVFAINVNAASQKKGEEFAAAERIEVPLLSDPGGKIAASYGVDGVVPSIYLISPGGTLAYQYKGSFSAEKDLGPQIAALSRAPQAQTRRETAQEQPAAGKALKFFIPQTRFEITFPKGWRQRPADPKNTHLFTFFHPGKSDHWRVAGIDVVLNNRVPPLILMKNRIADLRKRFGSSMEDLSRPAPLPGHPFAWTYSFQFTNNENVEVERCITIIPVLPLGTAIWLGYSAPVSRFAKDRKEMQKIMKSFKLRDQ